MSSLTGHCICNDPRPASGGKVCQHCGREIVKDISGKSDTIGEERKFAEWQIGMLEKGILQNRRMIHELRQRYGIQE